jgi:hypothetical protein
MTLFENRLADIPHREIPVELRARILAAARPRPSFFALLTAILKALFSFPHPLAWGAVAACWAVITILNFSGPRGEELYAVTPKNYGGPLPSAQEYFVRQAEEHSLLMSLLAGAEPVPTYQLRPQDL